MINVKDPSLNLSKITLQDLINDAVERKDKEALRFLEDNALAKVERTKKDGSSYEVTKPITMYRAQYLEKFCGYKVKSTAQKKTEEKIRNMFTEAFAKLK